MKKILFIVALVALGVKFVSITYEKEVKSSVDFSTEVRKFPLAIAMFYEKKFASKEERKTYEASFKKARKAFDMASKLTRYKDAGLEFFGIDSDNYQVQDMLQQYGITQLPTYMLFKEGQPLTTAQGVYVKKTGFLDKQEIISFIERHYGSTINDVLQEVHRLRQREIEERMYDGWSPYFYWGAPYGPYGYPYYYYPPYGGRAGFGFYIGG